MEVKVKRALKASINHWKEMIVLAEKMPERGRPEGCFLEKEGKKISWFAESCPLCNLFHTPFLDDNCVRNKRQCPLAQRYGRCGESSRNEWGRVVVAQTWAIWLLWAKKMLNQLESCQERNEETKIDVHQTSRGHS